MAQDVDGRRIAGRYELGAQLGEGGVGIVWRAEDTLLGRPVAIKEVELPPAVRDEQRAALQARVIREARAAARLSHPGAVTLFDVVQDGGQDYIVMELVEAPTLDQLVAGRGPLDPRHAAMVGLRLLATLEAAHRAGIVHRDVKPSNVLVRDDGTTKLTDFGTASLTGDPELTVTGVVVGSPAFMAPEQIKGLEVGPATDLWALGATLYFAVEGEPPFKSSKAQFEVLNAIVNDPPRPARRLGALGPVVNRLLCKESDRRPRSADVWYQLRRVAASRDPTATAAEPPADPAPRAATARHADPTREAASARTGTALHAGAAPDAGSAAPPNPARTRGAPPGTVTAGNAPAGTPSAEVASAECSSAGLAPDGRAAPSPAGSVPTNGAPAEAVPAATAAAATTTTTTTTTTEAVSAEGGAVSADGGAARADPRDDGSAGAAPPAAAAAAAAEGIPADSSPDTATPAEGVSSGGSGDDGGSEDRRPTRGAPVAPLPGGPAGGGSWRRRRWRRSGG